MESESNYKKLNPKDQPLTESELRKKEISKKLAILKLCNEKMTIAENLEAENLIKSQGTAYLSILDPTGLPTVRPFFDITKFKEVNQINPFVPVCH